MPLITVGCIKGRSGATATSLGLAAVLGASADPVVVECDPSGGDVGLRFDTKWTPGLVALASVARSARHTGAGGDLLAGYAQPIPVGDGVRVVCAPPAGQPTRAAVASLANVAAQVLHPPDRTVIVDCGRIDPASAAWPLLGVADLAIVILRGRIEDAGHLRGLIGDLAEAADSRLALLLTAGGVYGPDDIGGNVHRALVELGMPDVRVPVLGSLPYDSAAAQFLDGQRATPRRWQRSALMRALGAIAQALPSALLAESRARA